MIFNYKKFLIESYREDTEILNGFKQFYTLYKQNCTHHNAKQIKLYRGIERDEDFLLIDPTKYKRDTVTGISVINYIVDNSKYWNDYPNRRDSIFVMPNKNKAELFVNEGNIYWVIPYDNYNFGVCPKNKYMEISFKFLQNKIFRDSTNFWKNIQNIFKQILNINLNFSTYQNTEQSISTMQQNITIDFINNLKNNTLNKNIDLYITFFENYLKSQTTLMSYLEILYDPKMNGFNNTNNLDELSYLKDTDTELWTNNKCLLVNSEIIDTIEFKEYFNYNK